MPSSPSFMLYYKENMAATVQQKLLDFFKKYRKISYAKNEIILQPSDTIPNMLYIAEGLVRQYIITEDGEDITLHIFKHGSFFPIMLFLSNSSNTYFFETVSPTVIYEAPAQDVAHFLKQDVEVLFDLTTRLAQGISGLLIKIEHLTYKNSGHKLISLLLYLGNKFGNVEQDGTHITLPFTHTDLASWIGAQRETVSREMEKLKKENILSYQKNMIIIYDRPKLESLLQ
jgi:CRP/FNR family transcriptional regulator, cyclic AMP receptor protein